MPFLDQTLRLIRPLLLPRPPLSSDERQPRSLVTRSGDEKQTPFMEGKTENTEGANNAN
jgi:hypothetical protein